MGSDGSGGGTGLGGVPETTLWTLWNRASEAARPDSALDDPKAVELLRAIDYPYAAHFGAPSQSHPLRARCFDRAVRDFLALHPAGASVVALGEGLQTSFWRIGSDTVDWLSVDLPEIVALRRRLLPEARNLRTLACSALDRGWMTEVEPGRPTLVTAEGLLMYFTAEEVYALIADCAERFPGGRMVFDNIPQWFSRKTLEGLKVTPRYTAPPMPFAQSVAEALRLPERVPGVATATDLELPPGRGLWRHSARLGRLPGLRGIRPSVTMLTFDG